MHTEHGLHNAEQTFLPSENPHLESERVHRYLRLARRAAAVFYESIQDLFDYLSPLRTLTVIDGTYTEDRLESKV